MTSLIRLNIRKGTQYIHQNIRLVSTQQFIAGRKGYAPGFEAPEGTREEKKVVPKRRDIGHSLPSHLEGEKKRVDSNSPKKIYREALRSRRHGYAHELLEKHGQKQLKSKEKLELAEQKAQLVKEDLKKAKQEQQEHEKQVAELLNLENKNVVIEARTEKRNQNRIAFDSIQQEKRRKQLLKLYANTETFVTLDNLDTIIDNVMSPEGRSFHDGFNELMHNTNTVQSEIEQRKEQLKEAMGL